MISVACGDSHTVAIAGDSTLKSWGVNSSGQLGDSSIQNRNAPVTVKDISEVIKISAGGAHTIALKSDGSVWAWGDNSKGQLGDSSIVSSIMPVRVKTPEGPLDSIISVSAGRYHSCAVRYDGSVFSWGGNNNGQLGTGDTLGRLVATKIPGIDSASSVSCGHYHTTALKKNGKPVLWGFNWFGQLGDSTQTTRLSPVLPQYPFLCRDISAGSYHTLITDTSGAVWAAGYNYYGQLGDNSFSNRLFPAQANSDSAGSLFLKATIEQGGIAGPYEFLLTDMDTDPSALLITTASSDTSILPESGISISGSGTARTITLNPNPDKYGNVTAGITVTDGKSENYTGLNLKIYKAENKYNPEINFSGSQIEFHENGFPKRVDSLAGVNDSDLVDFSGGILNVRIDSNANSFDHLGIKTGGIVSVLDNGIYISGTKCAVFETSRDSTYSIQITFNGNAFNSEVREVVRSISYRNTSEAPLYNSKRISFSLTDGDGGNGGPWRKHINLIKSNDDPVLENIADISCGASHTLLLRTNGTVLSWGKNTYGQLGDSTNEDGITPSEVVTLESIVKISAGSEHSLALGADGTVWAWGRNNRGQLGNGTVNDINRPVQVFGLSGIVDIAAGGSHSLALKDDGTVYSWGYNIDGRLGDSTQTDRHTPVNPVGLNNIKSIKAGLYHSMALKSDGTVYVWGRNTSGQIGDNTLVYRSYPVEVQGLTNAEAIECGAENSYALLSDSTLRAWGKNSYGQIGDSTQENRLTPVTVSFVSEITGVAAGSEHCAVMTKNGNIYSWGRNNYGQLGDSSNSNSLSPVKLLLDDTLSPVKINSSGFHCGIVCDNGNVLAWGKNSSGQIGDSTKTHRHLPVFTLKKNGTAKENVFPVLKEDCGKTKFYYTAYDPDGSPIQESAESSNSLLIPADSLSLLDNGNFKSLSFNPSKDLYGNSVLSISISDGIVSKTIEFPVSILPVNDSPEITSVPVTQAYHTGTYSYKVSVYDPDDMNNGTDLVWQLDTFPQGMTLNDTGLLVWEPSIADTGFHRVALLAADGGEDSSEPAFQSFTLQIKHENHIPEIAGTNFNLEVDEDEEISITLSDIIVNDSDNVFPDDFTLFLFNNENYNLKDGKIIPSPDYFGELSVPAKVTDGLDTSALCSLLVTVTPVNDPPVITSADSGINIPEDSFFVVSMNNITVTDPDNDYPDEFRIFIIDGENFTVSSDTVFPEADFSGEITVPVYVNDGLANSNNHNLLIEVLPVNDPPEIISARDTSVPEDNTILLTLSLIDYSDPDDDIPELTVLPGTGYSLDGNSLTPAPDYYGNLTVGLRINDGVDTSDISEITLTVLPVNDAPEITSSPATETDAGQEYSFTIDASDPDDTNLKFYLIQGPSEMTVDENTGILNWYPENRNAGENPVTIAVFDADSAYDSLSYVLYVNTYTALEHKPGRFSENNNHGLTACPVPQSKENPVISFYFEAEGTVTYRLIIFDMLGRKTASTRLRKTEGFGKRTIKAAEINTLSYGFKKGGYFAVLEYKKDGEEKLYYQNTRFAVTNGR